MHYTSKISSFLFFYILIEVYQINFIVLNYILYIMSYYHNFIIMFDDDILFNSSHSYIIIINYYLV